MTAICKYFCLWPVEIILIVIFSAWQVLDLQNHFFIENFYLLLKNLKFVRGLIYFGFVVHVHHKTYIVLTIFVYVI